MHEIICLGLNLKQLRSKGDKLGGDMGVGDIKFVLSLSLKVDVYEF